MPQTIISIFGIPFSINSPYTEGHICSEAEARALHQAFLDRLRNNFSPKVKRAKDEAKAAQQPWPNEDATQALIKDFEAYLSTYTFGAKAPPKPPPDPFEQELEKQARLAVRARLKMDGRDPRDLDEETLSRYYETAKKHPPVIEEARRIAALFQDTALASLQLS